MLRKKTKNYNYSYIVAYLREIKSEFKVCGGIDRIVYVGPKSSINN